MTEGTFFAFIIAVFKLYDPVRKFAMFYNNFQQALGASAAIFTFMDDEDDVLEKRSAFQLPGFKDAIEFQDVSFRYQTPSETSPESSSENGAGENTVLDSINLTIPRGEVVAVVGPSGAGKSTLVNLIPRFFDVTEGRILLDGHDLRDVRLESLRRLIGNVTQETILFNDTVRNNIAYGQPDVPLERVYAAAQAALAHDFIERLPEKYDTIIGEKGFRLSGGERQRLAIARALLKNAPILILDEATSSLDLESESLVQAALANLMQGRTSFVIAHRLSTIRRATRIVVLEDGKISDIGSHEQLLVSSQTYQRLYRLQFHEGDTVPANPEMVLTEAVGEKA
jgi:subfamily B ATP-binding cassette protein MsbA